VSWTEVIGFIGLAFGLFVNIPQAVLIYKNKDSRNVSLTTYVLLLVCVICYFIHAVAIRDAVFITSNGLAVFVTTTVIILIRRYRYGKGSDN